MKIRPARVVLASLLLSLLAACSDSGDDRRQDVEQKYFFLESLRQVEAGGRQLQNAAADRESLEQALVMLDEGLKLAFRVEREFLDRLDLRLGKNYQRYFIEGVENYRIGIEAGDREQQQAGLRLLARWAEFWGPEQAEIRSRLDPG